MVKEKFFMIAVMSAIVFSVFTSCKKEEEEEDKGVEAEWVDLGLPSGLLWATYNIGATAPEEYGQVFGWGETQSKTEYTWANYAHGSDPYSLTKYCSDTYYGFEDYTDNLVTLQASDDAATVIWKNGARMPTKEECQELIHNCTNVWTTRNGITGQEFTGPNGNTIFLPAAGYRWGTELDCTRRNGAYWTRSLNGNDPSTAWYLGFTEDNVYVNFKQRSYGRYVRPVHPAQ